jgi:hypothetical protein
MPEAEKEGLQPQLQYRPDEQFANVKQCDQAQPSCSRCVRLKIKCIGSGQRRYKWVDESSPSTSNSTPEDEDTLETEHQVVLQAKEHTHRYISMSPSNEMTIVTGAFFSAFEIKDVRYDLSTYGEFLKDIPRRLGSSPALDASVKAFTNSCSLVHSRQASTQAYESYIDALKALRDDINNPKEAGSANTMCAVYLIMICQVRAALDEALAILTSNQGWIGQRDDYALGHGEVLAHLLSTVSSQNLEGQFESELMLTLCVPVVRIANFHFHIK